MLCSCSGTLRSGHFLETKYKVLNCSVDVAYFADLHTSCLALEVSYPVKQKAVLRRDDCCFPASDCLQLLDFSLYKDLMNYGCHSSPKKIIPFFTQGDNVQINDLTDLYGRGNKNSFVSCYVEDQPHHSVAYLLPYWGFFLGSVRRDCSLS